MWGSRSGESSISSGGLISKWFDRVQKVSLNVEAYYHPLQGMSHSYNRLMHVMTDNCRQQSIDLSKEKWRNTIFIDALQGRVELRRWVRALTMFVSSMSSDISPMPSCHTYIDILCNQKQSNVGSRSGVIPFSTTPIARQGRVNKVSSSVNICIVHVERYLTHAIVAYR